MRFESDIWHYNIIVQGLLYLMSPDVLTLDLEEVSDILFLHVSHTLVSSYVLAKIVLRKINSRGALVNCALVVF